MPWHKPLCSTTIYLQGGHPLTAHASLPPQQRWTVTNMPETNVLNYPQLTPSPEDGSLTCDGILTKCTDSEADGMLLLRNRHFICQVHLGLRMPRPQHRGSYMCLQGTPHAVGAATRAVKPFVSNMYLFGCASVSYGTWDLFSCGMWDLLLWPGMEPGPSALEARSLSHRTTKEDASCQSFTGYEQSLF